MAKEPECPFCELYPYAGDDDTIVDCCKYGQAFFGEGVPYNQVKQQFVEQEGYEPPLRWSGARANRRETPDDPAA